MKFNAKKQQQNDINRNIEGVEEARPIKKARTAGVHIE